MGGARPTTGRRWANGAAALAGAFATTRIGRPTGIAVGSHGSLFVADDQNGLVYRIRPMG